MFPRIFVRQCFVWFLGLCAALLCSLPGWAQAQHSWVGVYHPNYGTSSGTLYISGTSGASGTIDSRDGAVSQAFSIPASGMVAVGIPSSQILTPSNTIVDKAITVRSSTPLNVYFLNDYVSGASADMAYLFESSTLGSEYRVLAWPGIISGYPAQMSVTALEDNTAVTVTPASALVGGHLAGTPINVVLDAGQSILYEAVDTADITGSTMRADKAVAVFAGARCARTSIGACDHLFTQLPPVNAFGTEYMIAQTIPTGSAHNVVRILAHEDATDVTVNGTLVATLNAGQYYDAPDAHVTSTKPVLVGQLLTGSTGSLGDPSLTVIAPLPQALASYGFVVPDGSLVFAENTLNLVLPTAALSALTLDGAPVDTSLARQMGSSNYWALNVPATTPGAHTVAANAPFAATLAGFRPAASYLTLIGPIKAPPPPPPPPVLHATPIPVGGWWSLLWTIAGILALAGAADRLAKHRRRAI